MKGNSTLFFLKTLKSALICNSDGFAWVTLLEATKHTSLREKYSSLFFSF